MGGREGGEDRRRRSLRRAVGGGGGLQRSGCLCAQGRGLVLGAIRGCLVVEQAQEASRQPLPSAPAGRQDSMSWESVVGPTSIAESSAKSSILASSSAQDAGGEAAWAPAGLAKRVPKPRLSAKSHAGNSEAVARYTALCKIIEWLELHPDRIVATWSLIESQDAAGSGKDPKALRESARWNAEYRHVWRLPLYWVASWLAQRYPSVFTKD